MTNQPVFFTLTLLFGALACGDRRPGAPPASARDSADSTFALVQARGREAMGVDQYTSTHQFEPLPDGGRITLRTRAEDADAVTVYVADDGIGIAPENVARIYDPFFTTKGVGRGTGLGLAVSYGIVQEHSGHIAVESAPGRGTTFRITVPTVQARARLQAAGD